MTNGEIKELLKTREPILYHNIGDDTWSEYAYISAVITRYNPKTNEYYMTIEIMDKNLHGVVIDTPDKIKRKCSGGNTAENTAEKNIENDIQKIQQETLNKIKEAQK
jgi:hypothetical protein